MKSHLPILFLLTIEFYSTNGEKRQQSNVLHPILLIPGYMGSLLEGTWTRDEVAHPYCSRSTNPPQTMWFSTTNYSPMLQNCWLDNIRMSYDYTTRRSSSDKGVNIYVRDFGGGSSVDFISNEKIRDTTYFYNMIESFVNKLGYTRGHNVRGAPYDWRRAIHENDEFSENFKLLIEETWKQNNETPTIIICHSMGCLFSYSFLLDQSQVWKDKFVKSWVVLGAPLGGTFKYMYGSFADDDYPASMFPIIRQAERTFSSKQFLLPRPATYGNDVLVESDSKNYTANDYREFFAALNQSFAYEQWLDTKDIYPDVPTMPSPGNFSILCVTGVSQRTLEKAFIEGDLNPTRVRWRSIYGDGDAYVNIKSGRRCQSFGDNTRHFTYRELKVEHMEMIRGREGISVVTDFVDSINQASSDEKRQKGSTTTTTTPPSTVPM